MTSYRFSARRQPPVGDPPDLPPEINGAGGPDGWLAQGPPHRPLEQLIWFARPAGTLYANDADTHDAADLERFEACLNTEAASKHRLRWLWAAALLAAALRPRPRNDLNAARSILDLAEPAIQRLRTLTGSPLDLPERDSQLTHNDLLLHLARDPDPRLQAVADAVATYAGDNTRPLLATSDEGCVRAHSVPFPTVTPADGRQHGNLLVFHAAVWGTPLHRTQATAYPSLVWMPALPAQDFLRTVDQAWQQADRDTPPTRKFAATPVAWWITNHDWGTDDNDFQPSHHARDLAQLSGPSAGAAAYLAFRAALTGTHLDLTALADSSDTDHGPRPVAVTGGTPATNGTKPTTTRNETKCDRT